MVLESSFWHLDFITKITTDWASIQHGSGKHGLNPNTPSHSTLMLTDSQALSFLYSKTSRHNVNDAICVLKKLVKRLSNNNFCWKMYSKRKYIKTNEAVGERAREWYNTEIFRNILFQLIKIFTIHINQKLVSTSFKPPPKGLWT